jgi:hypothetical protein
METPFFPVSLYDLPSHLAIQELKDMEFQISKVKVGKVCESSRHLRRLSALYQRRIGRLHAGQRTVRASQNAIRGAERN